MFTNTLRRIVTNTSRHWARPQLAAVQIIRQVWVFPQLWGTGKAHTLTKYSPANNLSPQLENMDNLSATHKQNNNKTIRNCWHKRFIFYAFFFTQDVKFILLQQYWYDKDTLIILKRIGWATGHGNWCKQWTFDKLCAYQRHQIFSSVW